MFALSAASAVTGMMGAALPILASTESSVEIRFLNRLDNFLVEQGLTERDAPWERVIEVVSQPRSIMTRKIRSGEPFFKAAQRIHMYLTVGNDPMETPKAIHEVVLAGFWNREISREELIDLYAEKIVNMIEAGLNMTISTEMARIQSVLGINAGAERAQAQAEIADSLMNSRLGSRARPLYAALMDNVASDEFALHAKGAVGMALVGDMESAVKILQERIEYARTLDEPAARAAGLAETAAGIAMAEFEEWALETFQEARSLLSLIEDEQERARIVELIMSKITDLGLRESLTPSP